MLVFVCVSPQRIPTSRANSTEAVCQVTLAVLTASIRITSSKNAKWAALTRHSADCLSTRGALHCHSHSPIHSFTHAFMR